MIDAKNILLLMYLLYTISTNKRTACSTNNKLVHETSNLCSCILFEIALMRNECNIFVILIVV